MTIWIQRSSDTRSDSAGLFPENKIKAKGRGRLRLTMERTVFHLFRLLLLFGFAMATVPAPATTITVTSTADSGAGTLRAALTNSGKNDVINFSLAYPATIALTTGELLVASNVTIVGPGAANLVISGSSSSRVFHVGSSKRTSISGLTIANGLATGGSEGAGIYVDHANLALMDCIVRDNHASGGGTASGAGMYVDQSQLTATGCTFTNNVSTGNGGGIYATGSISILANNTISTNTAISGGGIHNDSGSLALTGCLIYANSATHGGGLTNSGGLLGSATLTANNCTVSSNIVSGSGATGSQVHNTRQFNDGSIMISNCTVVSDQVASGFTGGALYDDNGASITLGNTILQASAQEHTIVRTGTSSVVSAGYNLSFDNGGGFLTATGDQINTNPLLDLSSGPRDNGGPTFTIPLQANSPAIDKGNRDAVSTLMASVDQRGEPRPYDNTAIANAVGGDGSDIGAYEADFRMTKIERMTSDLQLGCTSIVGKTYQLQARSSLVSGTWTSLGGAVSGNGGIIGLPATGAFAQPRQFYRILQTP